MRKIKFRAWIPNEKIFDYNDIFIRASGNPVIYKGEERDDIILNQFTGLTDKNGKEIYEGDVLKNGVMVGFVEWDKNGYYVMEKGDDEYHLGDADLGDAPEFWEVIGNIYENSELINN